MSEVLYKTHRDGLRYAKFEGTVWFPICDIASQAGVGRPGVAKLTAMVREKFRTVTVRHRKGVVVVAGADAPSVHKLACGKLPRVGIYPMLHDLDDGDDTVLRKDDIIGRTKPEDFVPAYQVSGLLRSTDVDGVRYARVWGKIWFPLADVAHKVGVVNPSAGHRMAVNAGWETFGLRFRNVTVMVMAEDAQEIAAQVFRAADDLEWPTVDAAGEETVTEQADVLWYCPAGTPCPKAEIGRAAVQPPAPEPQPVPPAPPEPEPAAKSVKADLDAAVALLQEAMKIAGISSMTVERDGATRLRVS